MLSKCTCGDAEAKFSQKAWFLRTGRARTAESWCCRQVRGILKEKRSLQAPPSSGFFLGPHPHLCLNNSKSPDFPCKLQEQSIPSGGHPVSCRRLKSGDFLHVRATSERQHVKARQPPARQILGLGIHTVNRHIILQKVSSSGQLLPLWDPRRWNSGFSLKPWL